MKNIGELQKDDHGTFRIIGGNKIYQIIDPKHKAVNDAINRMRASN